MGAPATIAFGDLLKDYRLAAGLTQEALAERAGVSARNIQNLERGENKPLKDTARRLAEALALGERDRALFLTAVIPVPRRRVATIIALPAPEPPLPPEEEAALGTGMLAVLVADVRGYTAFTHAHGDAAGARLAARFAELAEAVVVGEGGRVVEIRGDEVLAVFGSARAALLAAAGLLTRCAQEATPDLPLRAGVGLDVGEPVTVPGGYRGEVINTAARLCAQAGPGEVLASEAVVGLARRVEGLAYAERGALTLRGLSRPVRAWLVRAGEKEPGPAGAITAPASVPTPPPAAPRHNLPVALSSFIGRERERERVGELLAAYRLVTLVGTGGVGKTRLALAVAEDRLASNPDGVWLVELAPLADPALVPTALAQVLGLREEAGRPILETLSNYLKEKSLLLVLDNCEHLVAACAALASALLRACPDLRILATSREALAVAGEHRYRAPSLSVPDPRHLPPPELAGSYEAVRLFVERAAERRDDFTLTPGNARVVAEVCARLDGVPLAIELAAARVGSLSVESIAARLDDRFKLLTGGGRDLPNRQRTLRAALDWSWDLLAEGEQALLARLAVFAGGWTLDAAEAVCAGDDLEAWAVLDALDALVSKSLVQADESGEEAGRYRLLETIRQYATERLGERGEAAAMRYRHLAWCLDLAEQAFEPLMGPDQAAWLVRLETEHDNLRAALAWARERGAVELGVRLAGPLWRFWWLHGHLSEGRAWLEAALSAGEGSDPGARGTALNGAGILARYQGAYERATALHEEALAIHRSIEDTAGIANTLNNLGMVAYQQGEYERATLLHEEALTLRRALEDRRGIAFSLNNLGLVAEARGEYARAATMHEEALALQRALGNTSGIAASLGNRGIVAGHMGDYARAANLFGEALAIHRAMADHQGIARALNCLGLVAFQQGQYEHAATLHEESLALRRALGDQSGIADSLNNLGDVAREQGEYGRATVLIEEALTIKRGLGAKDDLANALHSLGSLAERQGEYGKAVALYEESLALTRELGNSWGMAQVLGKLGHVATIQGEFGQAMTLLLEALSLSRGIGAREQVANLLENIAHLALALGDPLRAARLGGAAEGLREALGQPLTPGERGDHDRAIAALRAVLGEAAFAAAWAEGRALPLDEAIALALAESSVMDR